MAFRLAGFRAALAMGFLLLGTAGFLSAAEAPQAAPKDRAEMTAFLGSLGRKVADFKTLKTDFTQEKEMALFKDKLVLRGRIYLEKPNKVAWHVDAPLRYSILITDKMIRQWDEDTNQVQEISLSRNPVFQNVLNQLTVWFSGDYSSLIETNAVRIVRQDPLTIEFLPLEKNITKKVVQGITLTFRDDRKYLQSIRIKEVSGDVTTILFSNTLLNAPLDSSDFEVRPVRKQGMLMEHHGIQLANANVYCSPNKVKFFSNGVKGHV
jgi:outer membrane lipoprotein carrier protein